ASGSCVVTVKVKKRIRTRKPRPSDGKIRVELYRLLIKTDGFQQGIARIVATCFKNQPAQIGIVSFGIVCGFSNQRLLLTTGQLRLQRFCDSFCDFALDAKDVIQLSIIGLGRELRVRLNMNYLNIDSNLICRFLDATRKNVRYAELLRDLREVARLALIPL